MIHLNQTKTELPPLLQKSSMCSSNNTVVRSLKYMCVLLAYVASLPTSKNNRNNSAYRAYKEEQREKGRKTEKQKRGGSRVDTDGADIQPIELSSHAGKVFYPPFIPGFPGQKLLARMEKRIDEGRQQTKESCASDRILMAQL